MGRTRTAAAAAGLGIALLATACSNGTSIQSPFSNSTPALHRGPEYEVTTGPVSGLGTVLVDGQGLTVYMFANDVRGAPSRCYNICAQAWPPVVLPPGRTSPVAGPGIHPALLATTRRTDGTLQLTYNGWPLYLWPPDRAPGKATGQALPNAGGLWYVLSPAGHPIVTPSP